MLEADLYKRVTTSAIRLGLAFHHSPDSRRQTPGWPDLILYGPGGILYRELKSDHGRPSRAQLHVGAALTASGADWAIWAPDQWRNGTISRQLLAIAVSTQVRPRGGNPGGASLTRKDERV